MSRKSTASAEPTTTAITPVETAIAPVDGGIMAVADDHTSKKLITDQEAMERLGQAVDIAVQRAEDAIPAAGINLLLGTRDFTKGSINLVGSSVYFTDGFLINNPSITSFAKDQYGFTVATMEQHRLTENNSARIDHSVFRVKKGDVITFSCEFMCEDFSELQTDVLIQAYEFNENSSSISSVSYTYKELTNNADKVNGKWVKFRFVKIIDNENTINLLIRFVLARNGKISMKKSYAQFGDIVNPTWSMSPFDVVEREIYLIEENFDLNNAGKSYKEYKCQISAIAGTVKNCPTKKAFALYITSVTTGLNDGWYNQIIIDRDSDVFLRYHDSSNVFSPWMKIQKEAV